MTTTAAVAAAEAAAVIVAMVAVTVAVVIVVGLLVVVIVTRSPQGRPLAPGRSMWSPATAMLLLLLLLPALTALQLGQRWVHQTDTWVVTCKERAEMEGKERRSASYLN